MKKYNRRKILLGSMLSVATAVKLILPIPVMAEETYCGHEAHQHTDECREEAHTHDDSCYEENLVCQEDHEHDDSCYEKELNCTTAEESGQAEYICDKEEHTHSLECYADLTADIETEEDWEKTLPKKAKDTFVETLLDVARSQLKYRESEKNYKVDESGTVKPYSRYGQWIDEPYGEMNLPFVAFVLHYANAEELPVTWTEGWDEFYRTAKEEELVQLEDHIPYKGDLILLEDTYAEGNYVGFVSSVDPFKAVVADVNGEVQEINLKEAKCNILGYIRPQEKPGEQEEENQITPEIDEGMLETDEYIIQKQTKIETGNYILTAEVDESSLRKSEKTGDLAQVSEEESSKDSKEKQKLELVLTEPEKDTDSIEQLKKEIEEFNEQQNKKLEEKQKESSYETEDDDIPVGRPSFEDPQTEVEETTSKDYEQSKPEQPKESLDFFQVKLQAGESVLDIGDIQIKMDILPKEELVQAMDSEKPVLSEVESGMDMTVYAQSEKELLTDQATYESDKPVVNAVKTEIQSGQVFAAESRATVYPEFTVQSFVQYNDQALSESSEGTLPIIETKMKDLPENGKGSGTSPTKAGIRYLELNKNKSSYSIKTNLMYVPAFQDKKYSYKDAPNPSYWDNFRANGNYRLVEICTYKSKNDADKRQNPINTYSPSTHFTNKPETAASKGYVLVTPGLFIQLCYEQTNGNNDVTGTLYDYDITNGSGTTNTGVDNANWGMSYGINSNANYQGQGASNVPNVPNGKKAKFAFGNDNTGTHLGRVKWNVNYLNAYNSNSYKGCTFGIAESFDTVTKKIKYASEIAVPDLFSETPTVGKNAYYNSKLRFKRIGDTYTLDSVSGTTSKNETISAKNLQNFTHPGYKKADGSTVKHDHIFTNNFWPLDDVKNKDPHTGEVGNLGTWKGWNWDKDTFPTTNNGKHSNKQDYPISDDGKAHNSMFGLHYTVKFTYDKDYTGPLVYTFFGDDDMWVFLNGQKVIDIGGVHSSVGQRVDLRTYLPKVGDGKEYTLEFFYTERGLSGSTCYMQFTLPSVTSVKPEYQAGDLQIEKVTDGVESDRSFTFNLELKGCEDDYNYKIYRKEDNLELSSDLITSDGGQITLQAGQYALIRHLPDQAQFTITENSEGTYMISTSSDGETFHSGNTISGTISSGNVAQVWFKNAWSSMPATGQNGILLPVVAGLGIATVSATFVIRKRKK